MSARIGTALGLCVSVLVGCGARSGVGPFSERDEADGFAGSGAFAGAAGVAGSAGSSAGGIGGAGTGGAGASPGVAGMTGGQSGHGASAGQAGSGGQAGAPCGPLVDDMEDGDGHICEGEGRYGVWYAFNDGSGSQWPPLTPAGTPIDVETLASPRGTSARAMHTFGGPFTDWGSGIGLDFAFDGTTYSSYAAGYYDGIVFYAKSATPLELDVRISSRPTAIAAYGGTCEREPCRPHTRRFALDDAWTEYRLAFNDIPRPPGVAAGDFMRGALLNLQFMAVDRGSPFDFWIDDVSFYRDRNCCVAPPAGCEGDIVVRDARLEQRVREAVGKPSGPLRCDDVCNVSPLNAARTNEPEPIRDLTGVGCMTALTDLSLAYNQVADLNPLITLGQLRVLNLAGNSVVDISPLAQLTELRVTDLWNNQVEDLSPLAALPKLESASLYANRITDLSPVAGAAWLRTVDLAGNLISDATPLASAHAENVRLSNNRITDVGQFLAFEGLTYLDLMGNPIPCETEAAELALLRQRVSVFGPCN